jgi:DNA-directed RNA polymerase alpha subunit
MARVFDPKKPHGLISGDVHGRVFEQDGVHFNADGQEWTPADSPVGVDNAEAAMRARIEADVKKKAERDRADLEAKIRAEVEAEVRAKVTAELAATKPADPAPAPATSAAAPATTAVDEQLGQQMDGGDAALATLGLSTKVISALEGSKITTVGALVACTEDQLVALPNFGPAALQAVKSALRKAGKRLAG